MIKNIQHENKNTDIIVIATILPKPDAMQNKGQATYLKDLIDLQNKYHIALLDMTSITQEMFKQKRSIDILANNVNHPSVFLIHIYASGLITLIDK